MLVKYSAFPNLTNLKYNNLTFIWELLKTSWGWAGPSSVQNWLARQANVIWFHRGFHWGQLPLCYSSIEVLFPWGCVPLGLSSIEVILHWGPLPLTSSSIEIIFLILLIILNKWRHEMKFITFKWKTTSNRRTFHVKEC